MTRTTGGEFESKVALVTGGGSGIGRAAALKFASVGARVCVADISSEGAAATCDMIQRAGGTAFAHVVDLAEADAVAALIKAVVSAYGQLNYAFNNAAIAQPPSGFLDVSEETFDRIIRVNLKSVWLCLKYEVPALIASGGGAIVNTSSLAGLIAIPAVSAYGIAKFGVIGMTKYAAAEFGPQRVRVNCICPSITKTPMSSDFFSADPKLQESVLSRQPIPKLIEPDEVASAVLWFCHESNQMITGVVLPIDGGWTVA